jgi:hypothetical protein
MKRSPQELLEMYAAICGTTVAAQQWLDAGFSPSDAKAYVDAGCFDVDRTLELKRNGISPRHRPHGPSVGLLRRQRCPL